MPAATPTTPAEHSNLFHHHNVFNEAAMRELSMMRRLLEALLAAERYDILQIVVGNFNYRESVLQDSPSTQGKRLLIPRYGTGQDGSQQAMVTSTPQRIVETSEGRLGGLITNYGPTPCFLYLCPLGDIQGGQTANRPAVWLSAGGGSWDFRFGNVLYGGTVCAATTTAGSTALTIAEF